MARSEQTFVAPPSLAVAAGATTPDPGGTAARGVLIWSTTTASLLQWSGTAWVRVAAAGDVTPSTTQTGTSYGLVLADAETEVRLTHASGCAVTVPNSSTQAFADDATVLLTAELAACSLVAAGGVTISGAGLVIPMHTGLTLRYRGGNVWRAIGASA